MTRSQVVTPFGPIEIEDSRSGDVLAVNLGLGYHLLTTRRLDVYLGAFLNTTQVPDPPSFEADGDLGFGGVLGLELPFGSGRWSLGASVRYLDAALDLTHTVTRDRSTLDFDPWIVELGLSYGF